MRIIRLEALDLEPNFIFKGGTSLSKVYQVIDRFSEDLDLGIHPSHLGYPENLFISALGRVRAAARAA